MLSRFKPIKFYRSYSNIPKPPIKNSPPGQNDLFIIFVSSLGMYFIFKNGGALKTG